MEYPFGCLLPAANRRYWPKADIKESDPLN
jgi:hypothetical protein